MDDEEFVLNFFDNNKYITELIYNNLKIDNNKMFIKKKFIKKIYKNKNKNEENVNGLVILYSSLCMSCKKYYNVFLNLAELYKKLDFFSINCYNVKDKNDNVVKDLNITEYPSLKLIKNNEIIDKKININNIENIMFLLDNINK